MKKILLPKLQFADFFDIHGFEYLNKLEMSKIRKNKIFQTIKYIQTRKAPRPDQIFNKILKVINIEI